MPTAVSMGLQALAKGLALQNPPTNVQKKIFLKIPGQNKINRSTQTYEKHQLVNRIDINPGKSNLRQRDHNSHPGRHKQGGHDDADHGTKGYRNNKPEPNVPGPERHNTASDVDQGNRFQARLDRPPEKKRVQGKPHGVQAEPDIRPTLGHKC